MSAHGYGLTHHALSEDNVADLDTDLEFVSQPSHTTRIMYSALVITPQEFQELLIESNNTIPLPVVQDGHLSGKELKAPRPSWRTVLQSPLGSYLTGVRTEYRFVQLAGHKGDFASGQAGILYKRATDLEKAAYEKLTRDPLRHFAPWYYKTVPLVDEDGVEAQHLEMQDLLSLFDNPSVMDIKMGTRTFLESEVSKTKRRMDLLEKMVKLDPDEPTEEEKEKGITKLRYMLFREKLSSSSTFGFRIEAIKTASEDPRSDFKTIRQRHEIMEALASFLPKDDALRSEVVKSFVERMGQFLRCLDRSHFFKTHEIIGSSLLFIYDSTGLAKFWMIDFGKTSPVDVPLSHDCDWELGNHEDGYLIGLHHLFDMLRELA